MTMKKIQILIYVMVAMCMTLHSCQKNEPEQPVEKGMKVVHFYAEEINTKTAFDDPVDGTYPTLWTANDENVKISLNYATAVDAEVIPSDDNKTASFKATMEDDESGSYQFYAMSPSSAQFNPISSATKSIGVVVPATQTHIEGSVDEAAQILFAKSETTAEFPESVNLSFKHALAYGKISFSNLDLGDAVITSVSLTASKNIAGRYNYNFETATLTENSAGSTITINTSNKSDIWFACAPVDLSNGGTMKFVINTTAGTYTRMVTFPADKGNFEAGNIAVFSVNMQGIELVAPQVYTLVKDKNSLTVDSEVIIVAQGADYAISTTQNTNNRAAAGIIKTGETVVDPADNVQVFNLVVGNKDNTAAFKVGEDYLYSVSEENHLKTGYLNDAASWNISVSPEGIATINNYANTAYNIKYNASSSLFSCYKTDQTAVCIYKKNGSGTSTQLFKPELAVPVLNVTADNSTKVITVAWTDVANATGYDVVCGEKQTSVNSGVQTASFTMDSYGTFDVSVTAKAEGYLSATALDKVTLTDPNADEVYYVKVTSAPADWSGKYLIVYENSETEAFVFNGTDAALNYITAEITPSGIKQSTKVDDESVTIEVVSGGYAVKTKNGYIYGNSSSNKLNFSSESKVNTISFDNGNCIITNGRILQFYNSGDSSRFRYYAEGKQKLVTLYKLQDN